MPQTINPQFPPDIEDYSQVARTDSYKEVLSSLGYGTVVVTEAEATLLIATGDWTDVTPS